MHRFQQQQRGNICLNKANTIYGNNGSNSNNKFWLIMLRPWLVLGLISALFLVTTWGGSNNPPVPAQVTRVSRRTTNLSTEHTPNNLLLMTTTAATTPHQQEPPKLQPEKVGRLRAGVGATTKMEATEGAAIGAMEKKGQQEADKEETATTAAPTMPNVVAEEPEGRKPESKEEEEELKQESKEEQTVAASKDNPQQQQQPTTQEAIDESTAAEATLTKKKDQQRRQLTFDDLEIGELIGEGSVNYVFDVTLPQWWHQQMQQLQQEQRHDDDSTSTNYNAAWWYHPQTDYVLKVADGQWRYMATQELHALRTLNANATAAAKHTILPLVWGDDAMVNPYYNQSNPQRNTETATTKTKSGNATETITTNTTSSSPRDLPKGADKEWRDYPLMAAIVVPKIPVRSRTCQDQFLHHNLHRTQHFMHSLLETLHYAHGLGINVNDISSSNVVCNERGTAIVTDWNNNMKVGEDAYDSQMNHGIVPPEYQFPKFPVLKNGNASSFNRSDPELQAPRELGDLPETLRQAPWISVNQTSVHAFDIWSSGIMFARYLWEDDCMLLRFAKLQRPEFGSNSSSTNNSATTATTEPKRFRNDRLASRQHFQYMMRMGLMMASNNTKFPLNPRGDQSDWVAFLWPDGMDNKRDDSDTHDDTLSNETWLLPMCETESYDSEEPWTCQRCQNLHQRGKLALSNTTFNNSRTDNTSTQDETSPKNDNEWQQKQHAAVDLIRQMIQLNLQDRPTAATLLQHPFFDGFEPPVLAGEKEEEDEEQEENKDNDEQSENKNDANEISGKDEKIMDESAVASAS